MATYTPRTTRTGMAGAQYWYGGYSNNPFLPTYGLPNCTCYAWGRTWENSGQQPWGLSTGDAGTWYNHSDQFQRGPASTPKLGAIICMSGGPPGTSGRGHVGVVEEIFTDGCVLFSNSGYYRGSDQNKWNDLYFYLVCGHPSDNYQTPRHGYVDHSYGGYNIQGFIYNPVDFDPDVVPPTPGPGPGPGPEPPDPGGLYPTRLLLYKKQFYRNQGRLITDVYN